MNSAPLTLVLGASPNPTRYSYLATERLQQHNFPVVPLGIRKGEINGQEIVTGRPHIENVHTITLYVGPARQVEWYDYILSLAPERIVFNPGTENTALQEMARQAGIETVEACTLVMLGIGNYFEAAPASAH